MSNLLEIKNLCVSFPTPRGNVEAVRNVFLSLGRGEAVGIVGESGSGKSTMAAAIIGLLDRPGRITDGSITFDEKKLTGLPNEELRKIRGKEIAVIFQDPSSSLNPLFTVGSQIGESLRFLEGIKGRQALDKAAGLLKMVGINDPYRRLKQYPHELSGGMRQRVMIAMALTGGPKLLIADEPTTALDVTIQAQILEIIRELKIKTGMSVLMITHNPGVAAQTADRIAVMYGGKIIETAPCGELFRNPRHPYTVGLLQSLPGLERGKPPVAIEGSPPDPLDLSPGCPFAPRCRFCLKICLVRTPRSAKITENHEFSCWLSDRRAGTGRIKE